MRILDLSRDPIDAETGMPGGLEPDEAPPRGTRFDEDDPEADPLPPVDLIWVLDFDLELFPDRAATLNGWTPTAAVDHLSDEHGITDPTDRWWMRRLIRALDAGRAEGRDLDDDEETDR